MKTEQKKKVTQEMYSLIFDKINEDINVLEKVINTLNTFEEKNKLHPKYIKMWRDILSVKSLDEMKYMLMADNDEGELLRSTSPFIGIVSLEERNTIIRRHLGRFKP